MEFPAPFYRWRPHPWHGLKTGDRAPGIVQAYIEITPFDLVKYEIDKSTGYLMVDRPNRSSSQPPTLYGFIPRTYCSRQVCELSPTAARGDHDPLDICVVSERPIDRAEIIVNARVVGGIQMVDHGEADDKIVAVLESDIVWSEARDISDLPVVFIERIRHYFETYKQVPGTPVNVSIESVYGVDHATKVVAASIADYQEGFGS
ncbi:MAG: inorganic pyrophosphatase [Rhodothermales bacterium]|nr:inorganic pyrophosphatase [Rhodothermales bacterium]